jgi:hypothetical protein
MKAKEIAEAKAVLEKHGLISEDSKKSKSSSMILFGEGSKEKKDEKQSVVDSVKSTITKRSAAGKFEGGTQFGEYLFIKKGMMRDK